MPALFCLFCYSGIASVTDKSLQGTRVITGYACDKCHMTWTEVTISKTPSRLSPPYAKTG